MNCSSSGADLRRATAPLQEGSPWETYADPRYAALPRELLLRTESLAAVGRRLQPYWHDAIVPDLQTGHTVLVTAHSNSLRAPVANLDRLSSDEVMSLNIPTGMPLRYDLDETWTPTVRGADTWSRTPRRGPPRWSPTKADDRDSRSPGRLATPFRRLPGPRETARGTRHRPHRTSH